MKKRAAVDVQVRRLPKSLREKLGRRAQRARMSMSRYAVTVLTEDIERPGLVAWLDEIATRAPVAGVSGAAIVRELRDEIEEGIED